MQYRAEAQQGGKQPVESEDRGALFDYAFEAAPIGIALVDTQGRIIKGNASFSRMVGLTKEELHLKPFRDFTYPEDLDLDLELFGEVLEGKRDGYLIEKRYLKPDGAIVHASLTVTAMRNANGRVVRFISQIQDITEQKRVERQLAERAAQLELAMEAIRGGFWHMDVENLRFETSERLAEFIGGPQAARLDLETYLSIIKPDDRDGASLADLIDGRVEQSVAEYRLATQHGERWMRCDRRLLRDDKGEPLRIVGVAIDFTAEHRRLEQMETSADTDALTGLLNRRGLTRRFTHTAFETGCGLLAIDLDGFKAVNDRFGHSAGDAVLVEMARRLRQSVREVDAVCRMGGDEFIVLIDGPETVVPDVAARIVAASAEPIALSPDIVTVRASVGGAWSAQRPEHLHHLMEAADGQLYEAKAAGKHTWRLCVIGSQELE
jgi:diguanylate cyclase (GGDEF)-like protein/PAS domain S-box-containing protein